MATFVHLRAHSDFSLSEGASKIGDLVAAAKAAGMPALALTDKDNLFGAMDFCKKASSSGVQPVVGAHLHMDLGDGKRGSFSLLAQDARGYANLCALVRAAHDPVPAADGTLKAPERPAVPTDVLESHADGLLLLTGGGKDALLPSLAARDRALAEQTYQWLLAVFGDRLYVEICRNRAVTEEEAEAEDFLIGLAYGRSGEVRCLDGQVRSEAPLVATSDVWYATPDRHQSWLMLRAIDGKSTIDMDGDQLVGVDATPHHLRSPAEMEALFADLPEALENSVNAARRCAFQVEGRKPVLPPFPCAEGRTEAQELAHQSHAGLARRFEQYAIPAERQQPYKERLDFELGVIEKMGFPGYFLIVADFIQWAKSNDIPVGPGRGSGAGSAVAWALTITDLDPLEYGLLFERFLNPERVSMPDFDVDFCETRRGEVIQYVQRKYGSDKVAMIATFGEIKAKTALTDAARILLHKQHGFFGHGEVKELTKVIPENPAEQKSLEGTYAESQEFRERIESSPKLRLLYEMARKIEGLNRNMSTHAAGVIIGDRPLHEYVPVTWNEKAQMPVCSFNMKGAETAGMVKHDFLGLKTLSVIQMALGYIKEFKGAAVDIAAIPKDDPEVYKLFGEGKTVGVFQFEGGGMQRMLKSIRPTRLADLTALNALYRPGPMDYIPDYAKRKNGEEEPFYPSPEEKTKPFLEETFGIMVYQEQVMQVAQACAGYSLGGADLLRRAMGKKIKEEMDKQRQIFIHGDPEAKPPVPGAVRLGMDPKTASELFDDIAKFAGYGFNKSHAAAYAWIAYQTMWLKRHYPVEFFSALMTYNNDSPEKLALIKDEFDDMGIKLLRPDVNASFADFKPEPVERDGYDGHAVRFGLGAIKTISGDLAPLIADRERGGPFTSLEDFHRRAGGHFNKAKLERLAEAGAFDGLAASRRQAASALGWLASRKEKAPAAQGSLFGDAAAIVVPKKVLEVPEWGDVVDREFKAVGFYFSKHPIDPYVQRLYSAGVRRRLSFYRYMAGENPRGEKHSQLEGRRLCVMVDDVKTKVSSRGTEYVEATVSERNDSYRINCYESSYSHEDREPFSLAEFRRILEGAKACRKPVVFVASLVMDRKTGENVWVNGREIWDVDQFLAEIRGDIVVRVDSAFVRLNSEEVRRCQTADDRVAEGSATPEQAEEVRAAVRDEAGRRRAADVAAVLEKMARADGDQQAVRVTVVGPDGERHMPGRYRFSLAAENVVKSMDGVVSVQEVLRGPAQEEPQQAAPAPGMR